MHATANHQIRLLDSSAMSLSEPLLSRCRMLIFMPRWVPQTRKWYFLCRSEVSGYGQYVPPAINFSDLFKQSLHAAGQEPVPGRADVAESAPYTFRAGLRRRT
jgi:hypothetical protein